jgi:predicted Co/Zn/Cd cation transporter (cation efflux family)
VPKTINPSACLALLLIFLVTALVQSVDRLTHGGRTDFSLGMVLLVAIVSQCPLWWAISYSRAGRSGESLRVQLNALSPDYRWMQLLLPTDRRSGKRDRSGDAR